MNATTFEPAIATLNLLLQCWSCPRLLEDTVEKVRKRFIRTLDAYFSGEEKNVWLPTLTYVGRLLNERRRAEC